MPAVTVMMPFYNASRWIQAAVESVLAQSFQDWEIILVDDGSTDESTAKLEPYLRDKRVRLLRQGHRGVSAARNLVLRHSLSPLIAVLDSDDTWHPERLRRAVAAMEAHQDCGLVYSGIFDMREDGTVFRERKPPWYPRGELFRRLLRDGNFIPAVTVTYRKDCLDSVGGYDETLDAMEDYDIYLRLASMYGFLLLPESLAYTRYHDRNTSLNEAAFPSWFRLLEKWDRLYPHLRREIRRRRAKTLYSYGLWHVWRGEQRLARRTFIQAMLADPRSPWPYYMFLKTFFLTEGTRADTPCP